MVRFTVATKEATLAIFKRFSQRDPEGSEGVELSRELRVQIVQILQEALGNEFSTYGKMNPVWDFGHRQMLKELGRYQLSDRFTRDDADGQCIAFLEEAPGADTADLVELLLLGLTAFYGRPGAWSQLHDLWHATTSADAAIDELNGRFRAANVPVASPLAS